MLDRHVSLRAGAAVLALSLLGLGGLVAFLMSGENAPPAQNSRAVPSGTATEAGLPEFVGDQACSGCHPAISDAHHRSRHAATLHPMVAGHLPAPFPDHPRFTDETTGLRYALERRRDRYLFEALAPGGTLAEPVGFAFGSGKTGI